MLRHGGGGCVVLLCSSSTSSLHSSPGTQQGFITAAQSDFLQEYSQVGPFLNEDWNYEYGNAERSRVTPDSQSPSLLPLPLKSPLIPSHPQRQPSQRLLQSLSPPRYQGPDDMGNQLTEIAPNTPFLPNFQSLHIVVIGLDSAGKTSLLYRLKLREFVETIPTKGFNTERIKVAVGSSRATTTFQVWDVGGQEKLRPLWKSYTRRTDGLVFVVDAAETERVEEAKVELHRISRSAENQGVPVLVLANKQDLAGAVSALEVEKALGLHELSSSTLHHTQGCSALDGQGLQPALEKLYEMILKRKKMLRHSKKKR